MPLFTNTLILKSVMMGKLYFTDGTKLSTLNSPNTPSTSNWTDGYISGVNNPLRVVQISHSGIGYYRPLPDQVDGEIYSAPIIFGGGTSYTVCPPVTAINLPSFSPPIISGITSGSYLWYSPLGTSLLPDYASGPINSPVNGPGIYIVEYKEPGSNGCKNNTPVTFSEKSLSVQPTSILSTANNFCSNEGGQFTLSAVGGILGSGAEYRWTIGSCNGTIISSGTSPTVTLPKPSVNTTYYCRIEGDCNQTTCTSISIVVHPVPNPPNFQKSWDLCLGDPSPTFTPTPGLGTKVYDPFPNLVATYNSTFSLLTTVSMNSTGQYMDYSVANISSYGCESDTIQLRFEIHSLPSATLEGDTLVCPGSNIDLSVNNLGVLSTVLTYEINGVAGTVSANQNVSSINIPNITDTTKFLLISVRDSLGCVSNSPLDSSTIFVIPPFSTLNNSKIEGCNWVCAGDTNRSHKYYFGSDLASDFNWNKLWVGDNVMTPLNTDTLKIKIQ